jgi:hypothetical protein
MNFELQYSTFVTFLDFYLTCGVLFRSDSINSSLVEFFEDDIMMRKQEFLKKGTFTKYSPDILALSIIKEIRMKYSLVGWTDELAQLTGYNDEDIVVVSCR